MLIVTDTHLPNVFRLNVAFGEVPHDGPAATVMSEIEYPGLVVEAKGPPANKACRLKRLQCLQPVTNERETRISRITKVGLRLSRDRMIEAYAPVHLSSERPSFTFTAFSSLFFLILH